MCIQCGCKTANPKFCSRSCAASYNNRKFPKRKPSQVCKRCQGLFAGTKTYCSEDCRVPDMTLGAAIYKKHHRSSAYALVRSRARRMAAKLQMSSCQVCDYSRHVEIAHRKPISKFPETALLSEINSPENLVALCPNHHWEMDHPL